jgi:hypothetical protein
LLRFLDPNFSFGDTRRAFGIRVKDEKVVMNQKIGKLEEGLLLAMKAIDNQVARALQRTPSEREDLGVQKWEPYETRIEHVTAFILNELGDNSVSIDSLLVLSQSFTKALRLISEDLGIAGLGNVRSAYCVDAMQKIRRDADKTLGELSTDSVI